MLEMDKNYFAALKGPHNSLIICLDGWFYLGRGDSYLSLARLSIENNFDGQQLVVFVWPSRI